MAYDLEEQEQLDQFKAWWKRYGNMVQWVLIVALAGLAAYQGWKYYQHKQVSEAAVLFEAMQNLQVSDIKAVRTASANIIENYAGTPYAAQAAVLAAHANYNAKDSKSAAAQLEWAMNNGKDSAVKTMATLQLAALRLEEKQYDVALKLLSGSHDSGFTGLVEDLKGDILMAQGKKAEARKAYEEALKNLDVDGEYRKYTEYKLDSTGS
jgi:predicted negative regulator of RcsB-dependent stress response